MTERSFEELQRELDELVARLERGDVPLDEALALWERGQELYRACAERLDRAGVRLQALSPRATLARGYAIVRAGGAVVRDARAVGVGGAIDVELASGGLGARVEEVRP